MSDQRKETELEAKLSPRLSLLGQGTAVISKEFLAYTPDFPYVSISLLFWQPKVVSFAMWMDVAL